MREKRQNEFKTSAWEISNLMHYCTHCSILPAGWAAAFPQWKASPWIPGAGDWGKQRLCPESCKPPTISPSPGTAREATRWCTAEWPAARSQPWRVGSGSCRIRWIHVGCFSGGFYVSLGPRSAGYLLLPQIKLVHSKFIFNWGCRTTPPPALSPNGWLLSPFVSGGASLIPQTSQRRFHWEEGDDRPKQWKNVPRHFCCQ